MAEFNIIFMGTPGFATGCLQHLHENGIRIAAVVTAPDKPAGRGQQPTPSAVKEYALSQGLHILQPSNLKAPEFLNELQQIGADLFVVVAFRMLPEVVWAMPPKGTVNLHASLLPQYRGAAPINHVLINGETETGVTTFFIRHEIDTGDIIDRVKVAIGAEETAGELHDKLMHTGADLLLRTVEAIRDKRVKAQPQDHSSALKHAPKIFKDDCRIHWDRPGTDVFNQIRGLSPYPAAWTEWLVQGKNPLSLKIYHSRISTGKGEPGQLETDEKTFLKVFTADGALLIEELQLAGKRRMHIEEFLRGTRIPPESRFS